MSSVLKKILPRALQATGSPTDLESTWAQQDALPPCVPADSLLTETRRENLIYAQLWTLAFPITLSA